MYSGIYYASQIPSHTTCIIAVFLLPHGIATLILSPHVHDDGNLELRSSGKKLGDPGFYPLLKDAQDNYGSRYIASFKDRLVISEKSDHLLAVQSITLFG